MKENLVNLTLDMPEVEAFAMADLAKRLAFVDVREHAVDEAEAYAMIYSMRRLRDALAKCGVHVR